MKKSSFKKLLCLLVLTPFIFTSCGSDDDNNNQTTQNMLNYNGEEFEINSVFTEYYGETSPGVYNSDLNITDAVVTSTNGYPSSTSSDFYVIYLEAFSNTPDGLAPGTYNYLSEDNPETAFTFDYGDIAFGLDSDMIEEFDDYIEISSGSLTISGDNTFELDFNGVDQTNNSFSGHYEGTLMNFDATGDMYLRTAPANSLKRSKK
ncbi:hypothetical protein SAMN05216480_101486 [Pustulibacterium marinum]|uniref:Uncharacterized protein n=1 Tax=Pustulibacterium marinum TaxID=1224947 RepID=A0A1I7F036_9FLAO|nr:hypothetical protein [Pustulibacterium marinum]SFU29517.1 hypothetical protein SAMN05216480_101486 [Pustulibacterium marinum]